MSNYKNVKDFLKNSYNTSSVPTGVNYYTRFLLNKCQNLFIYDGLPDSIPSWELEKSLIIKGNGAVIKKKGKLYVPFTGSVYGYDEYYVPNKFTFAQPVLGSGSYEDGKDCAIIWNTEADKIDYNNSILFDTIKRYARLLADVESTFTSILIGQRTGRVGIAQSSQTAQAVDEVMKKLELGETKTILNNTNPILDTFQLLNFMPGGNLIDFSTTRDYLLNCFYNEIGLQTLEQKKERMITGELEVDNQVLSNNILSMYDMRIKNVRHINEVFGTDITVTISNLLGGVE